MAASWQMLNMQHFLLLILGRKVSRMFNTVISYVLAERYV
jgi:hypothetical protein